MSHTLEQWFQEALLPKGKEKDKRPESNMREIIEKWGKTQSTEFLEPFKQTGLQVLRGIK
jgi:hypothetical protein